MRSTESIKITTTTVAVSLVIHNPLEGEAQRDYKACRWRSNISVEEGVESADCDLVERISGVRNRDCLDQVRVKEGVCALCCRTAEPTPKVLNPTVASRIIGLTQNIMQRGGVRGCTPVAAQQLQAWAIPQLQRLALCPEPKPMIHRFPYTGLCYHLGEKIGERPCIDCRGNVVRKVFSCQHELHEDTTIVDCRRCVDYDQPLKVGGVKTWSAGIVTAPRARWTLGRTLRSMKNAGWSSPQVFAEPGSRMPARFPDSRLTQRARKLGAWPNYVLAMTEMMMVDPHADAYLLCEDDVVFSKGLRRYLERTLWPENRLGVVSLYTPSHEEPERKKSGFFKLGKHWSWGSLAYVFPNAAARLFVGYPRVINHRSRGPNKGEIDTDVIVGSWCIEAGVSFWLHTPSLSQHIGETSTIWGGQPMDERRCAATFPGEEKDISAVMRARRRS
ncbi:MAG: hypothetical protein ACI8XO_003406 [Verrucomicrobiales bacterium]|jgi:hypothetical protein